MQTEKLKETINRAVDQIVYMKDGAPEARFRELVVNNIELCILIAEKDTLERVKESLSGNALNE